MMEITNSVAEAVKALVEQQRIANLIAFTIASAATFKHMESYRLNQEIADALGITLKPEYRVVEEA